MNKRIKEIRDDIFKKLNEDEYYEDGFWAALAKMKCVAYGEISRKIRHGLPCYKTLVTRSIIESKKDLNPSHC